MKNNNKINTNVLYKIKGFSKIILSIFIILLFLNISHADGPASSPSAVSDPIITSSQSSIETITQNNCEGLFTNNFDSSDNLMSSILSLCLPGVIKNLERLEQNECEKILCEYEAARQGISPIGCAKKSAYNTCLITGQGFDVVEGLLIGSLRQNIKNILENPIALGVEYIRKQAKQALTCQGSCSSMNSKLAAITLGGIEIFNAIETIKNLVNQLSSITDSSKTACEQLEEIRPELEKIVNEAKAAQGG